jgi:hypothetical protein
VACWLGTSALLAVIRRLVQGFLLRAGALFRGEGQVSVQREDTVPAGADVRASGREPKYPGYVLLRCSYRLYPDGPQREALARAFGCARVAFSDALAARRAARERGEPYLTDAAVSAALTAAKEAPGREWPGEASSVVPQQAAADLNAAYRNFFASVTRKRKGRRVA